MDRVLERRIPRAGAIAILTIAVLGVYSNGLGNGFVWDDHVQIVNNPWIKDVAYLDEIFSSDVFRHYQTVERTNYYRPVAHLVYLITWQLFGSSARAFHAVNLLLHLAVTVMVLLIAQRLLSPPPAAKRGRGKVRSAGPLDARIRWAALLAALLFGIHPVHTEAVDWVSGIMEPLYALFGLLSFHFFLGFLDSRDSPDHRKRQGGRALLLSALLFLLALFSKETAVVLLPLFLLWDLSRRERGAARPLRPAAYLPYLAAVGVYFAMRTHALGRFAPLDLHPELSDYECVINVFPLFAQHLAKLVWPLDLNAFHVFHPVRSIWEPRALLGLAVALGYLAALYWGWRRDRGICFSLLLILLPLLPFFYIRGIAPLLFAEQHLYLPCLGWVLLLARAALWVAARGLAWRRGLAAACLLLIGFYSVATLARNPVWKDDLTLWSDAASKSPESAFVHESLAGALLDRGRIDEAIRHYQRVLEAGPARPERVYNNLGVAYSRKGWNDRAIQTFERSLEIRPDYARAHLGLGIALYQQGRTEQSIAAFRRAIEHDPYLVDAYHNLGVAYIRLGDRAAAEEAMRQASRLHPEYYKRR